MNKKYIIIALILIMNQIAFAVELNDMKMFKQPAYRVGTTDDVENPIKKSKSVIEDKTVKEKVLPTQSPENLTYADLSIKRISKELAKDLNMDEEKMTTELSILWQGAASKSDIIKFALFKLSNPDEDKPNDKSVKKVLQTIANMSTLVGAGTGNAMMSAGSFIGGNILGIFAQDDKALNYKYTKVNDADMIILVRKIEDLQQNVINRYYDYITAKKYLEMTANMANERSKNYELAQNESKELILITDAYYREAVDMQRKAQADFMAKSASLEQLVGNEAFRQFEAQ